MTTDAADNLIGDRAPLNAGSASQTDATVQLPIRALYLQGSAEPFTAMFHPANRPHAKISALLCPPFGWEEMSSYRPRRGLAQALAQHGIAAMRIDLPGAGDSGGYPTDRDRLGAWTDAIATAASWLRDESGGSRVLAVGIGIGGLLAYYSTARGAAIDDLVLWGTSAKGRAFIRETSAFSRIEAAQYADDEHPHDELPSGSLSAAGYVISAETRAALDSLDATGLPLPAPDRRRVLLLERDGIRVDAQLHESLERQGLSVQSRPGPGYGQMMVEAQFASTPATVAAEIVSWALSGDSAATIDAAPAASVPRSSDVAQMTAPDGAPVEESFLTIPHVAGSMFGVLCKPQRQSAQITVLFVGGAGHRIGQNRMWVEAARRWASWGIPSVRLDLPGAGDADGVMAPDTPSLFRHERIEPINAAITALTDMGLPSRTVVIGLCAAAYWTLHAALDPSQEVLPVMLNPPALIWDERERIDRVSRYYLERLRSPESWRRLLLGQLSFGGARAHLRERTMGLLGGKRSQEEPGASTLQADQERVLDELRDRDQPAVIIFTGLELLYLDFQRRGWLEQVDRWPNLTVDFVPGRAGLHTLRPIWLQREAHKLLDNAVQRALDD